MKKSRIVAGIALCAALAAFTGCGNNNKQNQASDSGKASSGKTKLQVWSFTDELGGFIDAPGYGYKATHPDVEVEYTMTPTDPGQTHYSCWRA